MNYAVQYNALITRYETLLTLLRQVTRLLAGVAAVPASAGALRRAVELLEDQLGEQSEEESSDDDPVVEVAPALAGLAAAFAPFSGRSFRLAD